MQTIGVERNYMLGWIGGYMGNPKIEEQRATEAYEAGYEDGENTNTDDFSNWTESD
jgi:hypothetical protein